VKPAAWARRLPWSIVLLATALVALGWLAIARYDELAGHSSRWLRQQVLWSALALPAMLAISAANYRVLCRYSFAVYAAALGLLVAVYFFPAVNAAHRWIRLGPVGIQPSEFAKVAFVLVLAKYLMYRDNYRRLPGLMGPLGLALLPVVLILREPDLGTAAVFLPVLFAMLFVAGARRRDLVAVLLAGLAVCPLLWNQMSREQKSRVTALLDQPAAGEEPGDDAYHLYRAKQMRALGGIWGSALGGTADGDPPSLRLPYARNDFIACVVGERFGLVGLAVLLGAFGLLVHRAAGIAAATREPFGRLVAAGVAALLAVEFVVNVGMTVGLLPVTGLSLPLVSYGGSGLLAHAIALGLLLSVGARPGYEVTAEPFRYAAGKRLSDCATHPSGR